MRIILILWITGVLFGCQNEKPGEIQTENTTTKQEHTDEKAIENADPHVEELNNKEKEYLKHLKKDSESFTANYNLGRLYYNEAVRLIKQTDSVKYMELLNDPHAYDFPLSAFFYSLSLDDFEGKTFVLFSRAQVYFEKAHELNPEAEKVLEGLAGCYFSNQYMEKYERVMEKLENLGTGDSEGVQVEIDS